MATATLESPASRPNLSPPAFKRFYTPEEYIVLEEVSEWRNEYRNGEIVPMAGASPRHVAITANLIIHIGWHLKRTAFRVIPIDQRVSVPGTTLYTYPDVVVVEGDGEYEGSTLTNPRLIVEVLSESTESYDRGDKFSQYRTVDSLTDYILVSQTVPRVEHYARQPEGRWLFTPAEGLEAVLEIPTLNISLALADVYDKVTLPTPEPVSTSEEAPTEGTNV